jgi:ABC-type transporter Mla MlaB component
VEHTFFIGTLIGMRTKIVTLRLNQVSRQDCGTIAIVVGNGSRERRNRNTILHSICNNIAQGLLIIISDLLEVWRQQQVGNASILLIGISNLLQELSTNDTAGTEDFRDLTVVQIPVVFIRSARSWEKP